MKSEKALCLWTLLVLVAAAVVPAGRGLWLDLPSAGMKCISEELHSNVVVLGDYYSFIGDDYDVNNTVIPSISVKVMSPFGNNLHHQKNVSHGQFAFTTTENGNYVACFSADSDLHGGKTVTVGLDWKTGVAAKDWDSIAKKEKIKGLELELRKLEFSVRSVHQNLINLKEREAEMRTVSERTNARVAWYSILSLGVCIAVSVVQLWFLRRYFRRKKLI